MFSSAILMIILLNLLIIVNLAGYCFAAKLVGIRVDKFGFGLPIGPTLFKKKIGETEFVVHAFLFGGYASFPHDEEDCDLPKDSPRRFSNKTIGQRALVTSMGVIFNVLLAYFLIFFTGFIWKYLPSEKCTINIEKHTAESVELIKTEQISYFNLQKYLDNEHKNNDNSLNNTQTSIKVKIIPQYTETKTLKQLVPAVFNYVNYNIKTMFYAFGKFFTGKIPLNEMNEIIATTKISMEGGLFKGLLLTAIISLNLAILNILPLPTLAGGNLLFLFIEKITSKPVNKNFVEKVTTFFFYLLIALIIVITYNDLHAWIIGKI